MKLLFVSNLFPDRDEPIRGLDNVTLLHELRQRLRYEIRVIALRPALVPLMARLRLCRSGDESLHPTFVPTGYVPRIGSRWNDVIMTRTLRPFFESLVAEFKPDVVLASWLFPDGCAVAPLCREAALPLVLITQGSDTHQYLGDPIRRKKIVSAIATSKTVICRSGDLAKRLESVGVAPEKLTVIYNGVDPDVFFHRDKAEARRVLGAEEDTPSLLFVGNLLPVKNPIFLLHAHAGLNAARTEAGLRRVKLRIIGQGPLKQELKRETRTLETSMEVEFLGRREAREVALWMNASDILCLTSVNEGFPNVILEAMACGLSVVSTDVGGIAEKLKNFEDGELVSYGDLPGFVQALSAVLNQKTKTDSEKGLLWSHAALAYDQVLLNTTKAKI